MLYCTKCHGVCQDSTLKCPNCKSGKLRQVNDEDFVLLHRADQYTAQRLEKEFQARGISYQMEQFDGGRISYLYDSDIMPTDKMVLVRWGDYPAAKEISAQLKDDMEQERAAENGEETFEPMSRKKRIVVQIISVFVFLVVVMLVVFGADAVANWLKSLWS